MEDVFADLVALEAPGDQQVFESGEVLGPDDEVYVERAVLSLEELKNVNLC